MLRKALRGADAELGLRVKIFLASQHYPGLRRIHVTTHGDNVILEGRLSSFHERQLAVACCQRVAGVHCVIDRLVVADGDGWEEKPIYARPIHGYQPAAVEQLQFAETVETHAAEQIATKVVSRKNLSSTVVSHALPMVIAAPVLSRPK